jgi:hypothetical protein
MVPSGSGTFGLGRGHLGFRLSLPCSPLDGLGYLSGWILLQDPLVRRFQLGDPALDLGILEQLLFAAHRAPLLAAQNIQADVRSDSVQQAGRCARRQPFLVPQELHEGILHGIQSFVLVLQELTATSEHHGSILPVKSLNVDSQ